MSGPIRVLIADDDEPLAELIAENFEKQYPDVEGVVTTSVEEGFEKFKEGTIEAIVSDYDFRGDSMDGLDFLEKVRQLNEDFPFVLFTGKGSEDIAERATSNDVTAYIRKQTGVSQYSVLANTVFQAVKGYQAKKENQRRLSALEIAREGICIVSEDRTFEYANKAFLELHGYERRELIGKEWDEVTPDKEVERFYEEIVPLLKDSGEWRGEMTGVTRDGDEFTEIKSISTLDDGGLVIVTLNPNDVQSLTEGD